MNKTKALGGTRVHHSHVPPGAFVFKALWSASHFHLNSVSILFGARFAFLFFCHGINSLENACNSASIYN